MRSTKMLTWNVPRKGSSTTIVGNSKQETKKKWEKTVKREKIKSTERERKRERPCSMNAWNCLMASWEPTPISWCCCSATLNFTFLSFFLVLLQYNRIHTHLQAKGRWRKRRFNHINIQQRRRRTKSIQQRRAYHQQVLPNYKKFHSLLLNFLSLIYYLY